MLPSYGVKRTHDKVEAEIKNDRGFEPMAKIARLEKKLQSSIDSGDYYEAHQIYRSLYFRLLSQRNVTEVLKLMFDGALTLISKNEMDSGTDLAELFAEALQKLSISINSDILDQIETLYRKMGPTKDNCAAKKEANTGINDKCDKRDKFLQRVLEWSKSVSKGTRFGHPDLHKRIAVILWNEHNFEHSKCHFMLSDDGKTLASFLIDLHGRKGYINEIDLFIAQTVLQLLCKNKRQMAVTCFYWYAANHPGIHTDQPPFALPLVNFLWLLLLSVDSRKLTHFTILVEQYQLSVRRDPSFNDYLDKIGQLYFGVPPVQKQNTSPVKGLLDNLLKGVVGKQEQEQEQGNDMDSKVLEQDSDEYGTPPLSASPCANHLDLD